MNASITQLLDLDQLDANLFRSKFHRENFRKTLFGGQVLCQALAAASATVEGRLPHSLHAYFLRPGSSEIPVIYDVEVVRNGRSVSSRRVVARQFGNPILNMSVSFQIEEEGFFHAEPVADVPTAEEIKKKREYDSLKPEELDDQSPEQQALPFEIVPVNETLFTDKTPSSPEALIWMKVNEKLPDDPLVHLCALTFASDLGLLATALLPHNASLFDKNLFIASIDHAMWFHSNKFRADEWMLCSTYSPWAGNARGFALGKVYDSHKRLAISTAQEGMIRRL